MRYCTTNTAEGNFLDCIHNEYSALYLNDGEDEDEPQIPLGDYDAYYKKRKEDWWNFVQQKRQEFKIATGLKEILNGAIEFGTSQDAVWFTLNWS